MFFKRRPTAQSADAQSDEADLLRRYRATGDLALLGALYEPRMELVFAVCYRYLRDEEESKDAVMQLFEQLVTDLRKHEVTNFTSWLHSVARNYCLMQLRHRQVLAGREEFLDEALWNSVPNRIQPTRTPTGTAASISSRRASRRFRPSSTRR